VSVIVQSDCEVLIISLIKVYLCAASWFFPILVFHVISGVFDWSIFFFLFSSFTFLAIPITGNRARFIMADERKIKVERFNRRELRVLEDADRMLSVPERSLSSFRWKGPKA